MFQKLTILTLWGYGLQSPFKVKPASPLWTDDTTAGQEVSGDQQEESYDLVQ